MSSGTIYQTISLLFAQLARKIYFSYTANNVSDWEHSFTFVHNLLRFQIEYFSEASINDVTLLPPSARQ